MKSFGDFGTGKFSMSHERHIPIPVQVTIFPHEWLSSCGKRKIFAARGGIFPSQNRQMTSLVHFYHWHGDFWHFYYWHIDFWQSIKKACLSGQLASCASQAIWTSQANWASRASGQLETVIKVRPVRQKSQTSDVRQNSKFHICRTLSVAHSQKQFVLSRHNHHKELQ